MALDAAQIETDVEFLTSQPGWKDAGKRRDYIRGVGAKALQDESLDPEHHSAVLGELWKRSDDRGAVRKAGEFVGRSVTELAKSFPAAGGAAVLAATDAMNVTDTGSATRLKRGVAGLADAAVQRVKSLHPDDKQEQRDRALDALKADLDARAYPDGLEAWLAGASVDELDDESKQWVDGLTWGLARKAVAADHGALDVAQGSGGRELVRQWMESDRNPSRPDSETGGPGPKALLADYLVTRDPQSWEAFTARVKETDTQRKTRLQRFAAEAREFTPVVSSMSEGLEKDLTERSADFQTSPIDLVSTVVPLLKGAKAFQAARAGSKGKAALEAAKGAAWEAVAEAGTEALSDPNAPTSQILEAAAMGGVGAGALTGTAAGAGAVVERLVRPEVPAGTAGAEAPGESTERAEARTTNVSRTTSVSGGEETVLSRIAAASATDSASVTKGSGSPSPMTMGNTGAGSSPAAGSTSVAETSDGASEGTVDASTVGTAGDPAAPAAAVPAAPAAAPAVSEEGVPTSSAETTPGEAVAQPVETPVQLPPQFKGAMDHGAELVRQGVKDFAQWASAMVTRFGEAIRDYLSDVWAAVTRTSERGAVQLGGTVEKSAGEESGTGPGAVTDIEAASAAASGLPPGETAVSAASADQALETRSFGQRVAQDPRMAPKVQAQAAEQYVPVSNEETLAAANALIDERGLVGAAALVRDSGNGMPEHVRVALGMQTMLRMDAAARAARNAGDMAGASALWREVGDLGHVVDRLGTAAGRAVQAFSMWMRMTPEGLLTSWDRQLKEAHGGTLPEIPAELLTKLGDLRDKINALPEESPARADLVREMLNEMALFQGVPITSLLSAYWYANLLSGITTQLINVYGNGVGLMLRTLAAMPVNHPRDSLALLRGMLTGLGRAWTEARAALQGKVTSRNQQDLPSVSKHMQHNALEAMLGRPPSDLKSWTTWILSVGGLLKYVPRALTGMDAAFYYTAAEGRAHLAASRAARQGHTPGTPEFVQAMAEQLGGGAAQWEAAMDAARAQLVAAGKPVTANDVRRIAYQMRDAQRPVELREEAGRFGELVTSTQEPDGLGKWIYDGVKWAQRLPVLGKVFLPFARTLANLMSNAADFTPVGILRGIRGKHLVNPQNDFAAWERRERASAGVLGTTAMLSVWAMAAQHAEEDDESVPFMIYGFGPKRKSRRDTMPKGWKPFTIKIGDKYWSYAETPLVYALAPVGAILDAQRYTSDFDEKSTLDRFQYYTQTVLRTSFSQGVLSSMADLIGVTSGEVPMSKLPSRFTSGLIPGQGFLRDVTALFDPVKISDDTVAASILRDVPVVRHIYGKPALDYMGDTIQAEGLSRIPAVKRVVADQRSEDRDKAWVGKLRLTVAAFPKTIEVGKYLTKDEAFAAKASRIDAGMLTQDEQWQFVKRAGELTRDSVQMLRAAHPDPTKITEPEREQIQKILNARVTAARRIAMREVMFKQ